MLDRLKLNRVTEPNVVLVLQNQLKKYKHYSAWKNGFFIGIWSKKRRHLDCVIYFFKKLLGPKSSNHYFVK